MKSTLAVCLCCLLLAFCMQSSSAMAQTTGWPQWGQNPQRTGMVSNNGDNLDFQVASVTYDPFVSQEQASQGGSLLAHYQSPLIDGSSIYLLSESGTFSATTPHTRVWSEQKLTLSAGQLTTVWRFAPDGVPMDTPAGRRGEPTFRRALPRNRDY